ncbi:transposase [Patescibacteria group bacterium]|nr:transposase [Patescibacteria group bacterium]MBU1519264.1 transposase [Patescibacteria group bacterium]MBU2010118.1 transposase [Patescibacteria group bacterium]MBU2460828.1 transposase [Patescibacteria group bacterium]
MPAMDSEGTLVFLQEFKKQHPDEHVVVVWDNAPCHRRKDMSKIEGLTLIHLPSYSPELNPAERFFEEIRRETTNRVFESIEKQEDLITKAIKKWGDDTKRLKQLIGYEWIKRQWEVVN